MTECEVMHLVDKVCKIANVPYINSFFTVKGNAAGYFKPNKKHDLCELDFNSKMLVENPNTFKVTVIHEVAHWVRWVRAGYKQDFIGKRRDIHGAKWKATMVELATELNKQQNCELLKDVIVAPQRCHTYWI